MLVPKDAELQDYINLAGSGAVLVLEENNYKGSLLVDKDLTLRAQGGTYSASIEGSESAPALRVTDGAHLNLEELTVWGESSQAAVEVWDNSRVHSQRVRMVGGDTSFRIYEGAIDAQSVFAIGASSVLDLVDGTFTVRNAVLGYPDSEAQSALVLRSGTVRMESTIFDWRNDDGDWLDFATCPSAPINCDFQLSMYRSLAPGGEEALPTLQYLLDVGFEEPEFLLSPPDASYMAGSDLRLDHHSPAQDAGVDHDPDADGSMNDMGVFGGRLGNWKDVDNDRDGFSELEGDCDDTDPEVLGDPRRTCEESPGCASTPPGSSVLWLAGLLGLSARRRPR